MKKLLLVAALASAMASASVVAENIPAKLDWSQRVELGSLVSGVISKVHVAEGQKVKSGAALVSFDRRSFNADVKRAAAVADRAKLAEEEALLDAERNEELYERTVISDRELKLSQIDSRNAQAEAAIARAELLRARIDLERATVRSPFAGTVVAVNAAKGQAVVNGLQSLPLVTVVDSSTMLAVAEIDAASAAKLAIGDAVKLEVRGQVIDAAVKSIGMEANANGKYALRIGFSPEDTMRAGEAATIQLP